MKVNGKEEILTKEMITLMNGFEDLTVLSVVTLKLLQNTVCVKYLKNNEKKPCTGCPLNTLGICREITSYYKAYEGYERQ